MEEKKIVLDRRKRLALNIVFMALCGVSGVFIKHLINPVSNVITGALHIPGGVSTAVSLMFLVIAAGVTKQKWCAGTIGLVQGFTALSLGMVGSMGVFLPLAYIIPGVVVDLVMLIPDKGGFSAFLMAFFANILASLSAAIFANFMVFHLPGIVLMVYLIVSALSGAICGLLATVIINKINGFIENKE